ncbi:MAG TPA: TonB-dependent receptor [Steroidobacteraceae bacterium]|nr:TonB-dependent receptor [Steroidobacteraceae bacterium]
MTAQKRSENLQDVPIAITALSGGALSAAGVTNTLDLPTLAPGLQIHLSGGQILPYIRGVGQTATSITLENAVAIYVDGVYYASTAGGIFSLNDIEQVAVLRGPQGTLFGRNATGGVIEVTTRDPSSTVGGKAELTIGNLQTYGGSFYVTGPLENNVSGDLAVRYSNQRQGFGRNVLTGTEVNDLDDLNVRSKLKIAITDQATLTIAGDYARTLTANPAYRLFGASVPSAPNPPYPPSVGRFDVFSNVNPSTKIEQGGGSATLVYQFDFATLTSISAYRRTTWDFAFDTDAGPAPPSARGGQNEAQLTQEFQLVSRTNAPLQWTAGVFYFDNRGWFSPPVQVVLPTPTNSQLLFSAHPEATSLAGYLQGTYALTDKLKVTVGGRYTWEKREISGTQTLVPIPGLPIPDIVITGHHEQKTETRPTWRLAFDYRFNDQTLGYISYDRGFKSGGYNPTGITSDNPNPFVSSTGHYNVFNPEVIDAYETGLKLDLMDRRLRINPAFYYYKYDNLQVAVYQNGTQETLNAAKATIYGADLDATARITSQFDMTFGGAWTHGRYDQFDAAVFFTPLTQAQGGGNLLTTGNAAGNQIAPTPQWTLDVGAHYAIPLGSSRLVLNATYYRNGGWFADPQNRLKQAAYDLVNLSATYTRGALELSIWGRNMGNTVYSQEMYSSQAGDFTGVSPGRTYGATLGVKF